MRPGTPGKKLRDAARHVLGGAASDQAETIAALREAGAPAHVLDLYRDGDPDDGFELHEDNVEAVALFQASQTQWRHAGMTGLRVGLDYAGVAAAGALAGIAPTPDTFTGLRIMEAEALKIFAEQARRR